ncbi:uncharacterized protein LOC115760560 [Drosophila novamexicana]|uniref:uncharacterized protein LOC115760560 n=1 Tax=Drosophila novamexicana TaxID=47314 RepID=UPI0011E59168|nr:uncharacterized protein LOC115760560 [Drosophila novamexicana]
MHKRSKKPVWVLFKIFEFLISSISGYVHLNGLKDGIPHIFLPCATFGSGSIIGILSLVGTFFADQLTMWFEALTSGTLGTLYLANVYAHLYLVQHNKMLPFLKDLEEEEDGYILCCNRNAIISLYAVAIYYLHCTFALDILLFPGSGKDVPRSKRRLKLYFISKDVERYVSRFRWYQLLTASVLTKVAERKPTYFENVIRSKPSYLEHVHRSKPSI